MEGGRGLGSVRFGVAYERETERLTVTLVRARNLPSRNPGTGNACDPFVRLDIVVVCSAKTVTGKPSDLRLATSASIDENIYI